MSPGPRRPWHRRAVPFVLLGLGLLAAFLLLAGAGVGPARRGERALAALDPAVHAVRDGGKALVVALYGRKRAVAGLVTLVAAGLAAFAWWKGRRRAWPLLPALAALAVAAWGEVLLLDRGAAGPWVFAGALLLAALFGVLAPVAKLPLFPPLPAPDAPPQEDGDAWPRGWELAAVVGLSLAGIVLRLHALNQRPDFFDEELIDLMAGSATGWGFRNYVKGELLGTGGGIFHFLTQRVLYTLFGPSVYTVRLTSALWGAAAVPLLYALMRRLAGARPALLATVLFVASPEQLYWSRTENTMFSPVAAVALLTAHAALSLARTLSLRAAVCAALVMPLCRFSYTPSFVLFTLPLAVGAHGLLLRPGFRRRALVAAPVLAAGMALWALGPSLLVYATQKGEPFRYITPVRVHGAVAWRYDVDPRAGPLEVVKVQAERISRNLVKVARAATSDPETTSHWYLRWHASERNRIMLPAATAVLGLLGLFYLAAQPKDPRAVLLVVWLGAGLLPACMSKDPEARRLMVAFPAVPILAAIFAAAVVRAARQGLPVAASRAASRAFGFTAIVTAWAAVTAHLALPTGPIHRDDQMRFARRLVERSDTVLHNLFFRLGSTLGLASLDRLYFGPAPVCWAYVPDGGWLAAAVAPSCAPFDPIYRTALPADVLDARREAHRPRRVGYLLTLSGGGERPRRLLEGLFPDARRELQGDLLSLDVAPENRERLRALELSVAAGVTPGRVAVLLPGLPVGPGAALSGKGPRAAVLRGGLVLSREGWYAMEAAPACAGVGLSLDGAAASAPRPFLAGAHAFELTIADTAACGEPLRLSLLRFEPRGRQLSEQPVLTSPGVPSLREALPPPLVQGAGYGESRVAFTMNVPPAAFGLDGSGRLHLLSLDGGVWRLETRLPDGTPAHPPLELDLPRDPGTTSLDVRADGTVAATSQGQVEVVRDGRRLARFALAHEAASDVAFRGDEIVFAVPGRRQVESYTLDGRLLRQLGSASGGELFQEPAGLAALGSRLAVLERSGRVFILEGDLLESDFLVAYGELPFDTDLRNAIFLGPGRLLLPHHARPAPLVSTTRGERVLAGSPDDDLLASGLSEPGGFAHGEGALHVIDGVAVWRIPVR